MNRKWLEDGQRKEDLRFLWKDQDLDKKVIGQKKKKTQKNRKYLNFINPE